MAAKYLFLLWVPFGFSFVMDAFAFHATKDERTSWVRSRRKGYLKIVWGSFGDHRDCHMHSLEGITWIIGILMNPGEPGGRVFEGLFGFIWFSRPYFGSPGSPGKSHKEGQEDQGTLKKLGGVSPSSFTSPWSSWPCFWLFPGLPGTPSRDLL